MSKVQIINRYNELIKQIYIKHNLKCLRGLKGEYEIDGKNIFTWHNDAIEQFQGESNRFNFMKNLDSLFLVSDEIIYFLANTILYEPLINDPIRDKIDMGNGNYLYPNYQNLYAKRYDMYVDVCYEKVYNYWDRIGDLIAACIDTGLQQKYIYFASVINIIVKDYNNNADFQWLYDYYLNEYSYLNSVRKNIVHYFGSGTDFSQSHMFVTGNKKEISDLMNERRQIPNNLKSAMHNTIKGFKHTLDFLIFVGQDKSN